MKYWNLKPEGLWDWFLLIYGACCMVYGSYKFAGFIIQFLYF